MAKLQVCRVCLASNVKLYNMYQYKLVTPYEHVTGTEVTTTDRLPQQLCNYCRALLIKCEEFQTKCISTMALLNTIIEAEPTKSVSYQKLSKHAKYLKMPYSKTSTLVLDYIDEENTDSGNSGIQKSKESNTEKDKAEQEYETVSVVFSDDNDDIDDNNDNDHNNIDNDHNNIDNDHNNIDNDDDNDVYIVTKNVEIDSFDGFQFEIEKSIDSWDSYTLERANESVTPTNKNEHNATENIEGDTDEDSDMVPDQNKQIIDSVLKLFSSISTTNDGRKMVAELSDKVSHELQNPPPNMSIVHLSSEKQKKELEMRKESDNYKLSVCKCDLCYKGFICEKTLENHRKEFHDPSLPFVCELCHVTYRKRKGLDHHIMNCHVFKYICKECDMVCKSRIMADRHVKWHQGITYKCTMCEATFSKKSTQLSHIRLSHASLNVCRLCGENFVSQLGLKCHFSRTHRGETFEPIKELQCSCGVEFKTPDALETHVGLRYGNSCDTNMRPCIECGSSFENKSKLDSHKKVCHDQQWQQWFEKSSGLLRIKDAATTARALCLRDMWTKISDELPVEGTSTRTHWRETVPVRHVR